MAKSFAGELLHFGAVRMRVTGSGNLVLSLNSLSAADNSVDLTPIIMDSATNREPVVLANYIDAYGQLELSVEDIDEAFEIDRIVIFIKPHATGYPVT